MDRFERLILAQKRITSILRNHIVATERTLEQKISDAGPPYMRIEPFVLTKARKAMEDAGEVIPIIRSRTAGGGGQTPWYHLATTPKDQIEARLVELEPIYFETQDGIVSNRIGQALEIAVFKALKKSGENFMGGFEDLSKADKNGIYKKSDRGKTSISGKSIESGKLDFLMIRSKCLMGIEVKNYRQWLYPETGEVKYLLKKCSEIEAVPVLIARRIPFITFRLLNLSGGIVHQNYNQLYQDVDKELADKAKAKNLLGYHDVRVGNEPDRRMLKFICENLPKTAEELKDRFREFGNLHARYGKGEIEYEEWRKEILTRSGVWSPQEQVDEESGEPSK